MIYRELLSGFFVWWILITTVSAQVIRQDEQPQDLPLRIEISAQSVNETYRIIPAGKKGLILYYKSREVADPGYVNWYFACYDTNLQQVWVKPVPVPEDHMVLHMDNGADTIGLFFAPSGKSKNTDPRYEVLRIEPASGILLMNNGQSESISEYSDFVFRGDRAWIGMNSRGTSGMIRTIRLSDGKSGEIIPGAGPGLSVVKLYPDSVAGRILALVRRQMAKKTADYFLACFDSTGTIRYETLIGDPAFPAILAHFKLGFLPGGDVMVVGSYSAGNTQAVSTPDHELKVTGMFFSLIREGRQQIFKVYNFLEYRNAESFIAEKDILDLKKKALKKNRPLNEYSLDFQVFLHEPRFIGGQILLTAEVFSPQYHSETFTDFDFYGRPYTNSYTVFDGYRYSDAIFTGLDFSGNKLWDNTIGMRNFLTPEIRPHVEIYPSGGTIVCFYSNEGSIGSKIFDGYKTVEKTDFTRMDLMFPEDKLVEESRSSVQGWYADYFILSGYQEIKNIAQVINNKRLVYYFSKLRYEP